jgi:hypothetical protein
MERTYNSRLNPVPTGRPVHGSFYQLAVLDLLQQYDCLPSNYIKAAVFREAPGYCKDVLRLLKQERYIGIPDEAKHHEKVLSRPEIYELLPKGKLLLLTHGRHQPRTRPSGFRHQFLASLIKFSLDIAPNEYPDLKLMTERDMLAHEKCPQATAREANPSHIPLGNFIVKPDAPIFGYQYRAKAHMYFHGFEIDRGTEPLRPGSYQRQSIQGKVRHYRDYIARGLYRSRYGLSQITILFVTTKPQRLTGMLDVVREECAPEIARRFAFKSIPDWHQSFPPPTGHMVSEPWARVGASPLNILETLKETAERKA